MIVVVKKEVTWGRMGYIHMRVHFPWNNTCHIVGDTCHILLPTHPSLPSPNIPMSSALLYENGNGNRQT